MESGFRVLETLKDILKGRPSARCPPPPSTQEITLFFRTFRPSSADLLHGRTACGRTLFFSFVTFSNFQACFWIFRTEIRVSDNKTVEKRQSFLRNTGVGEVCSTWGRDNTTVEQHRFCSDGRTVDVLRRQHRFYFLPLICPFFASPLCSGR